MRYLLLSDIHANIVALDAVVNDATTRGWDAVVFLGDAVGYYPEPEAVVDRLRSLEPAVALLGNHDALLLDTIDGELGDGREQGVVAEVLRDHAERVSAESVAFLRELVQVHRDDGWMATHGALRHRWSYLDSIAVAEGNLPLLEERICLVGHTHVPRVFAALEVGDRAMWRTVPFRKERASYVVPPQARAFVNPGSVGQPRDGIPLASYAIFDAAKGEIEVFRVPFDIDRVARAVRDAGYPGALGERLRGGQ